jgi:hypothetical protein
MSKLAAVSAKPTLREYAQGAAQRAVSPVAEFIAPTVPVSTSLGKYKQYDEKNRFHLPSTERAIGGRATEVGFSASDATYNCSPHALDYPIDMLEKIEAEPLENMLMEGSQIVAEIAGLVHEKTVIDAAITAAGAGTALSVGSSDDVVDQIDAQILAVLKAAGYGALMSVGIVFGAEIWKAIKNHVSVRNRFTVSGAARQASPLATLTAGDFASTLLGQPEIKASFMVYDTAAEGVAKSLDFVLGKSLLVFARHANPTRRDPSFMKTFRLMGQFMVPGTYARDDGRVEVAKFDWSEDVKVTNSSAVKRLYIS